MPRVQGRTGSALVMDDLMPRVQGRTGLALVMDDLMPRVHGRTRSALFIITADSQPYDRNKMRSLYIVSALLVAGNSNALFAETVKPDSEEAKINYSVGYQVGGDFKRQKIKMDEAAFIQGLRDALAETTPAMTEHEMRSTLVGLKKRIMEEQQREKGEQAKVNTEKGNAYLTENKKKEGVVVLPSGLQYRVITEGKGKSPGASDKVSVHYTGTLIDGTVFDSSHDRGKPAEFTADRVIKGWAEALQLMKEGSKWELAIPAELAYGTRGAGKKIPPNSTLLFEVELLSVVKQEENKASK